MRHAFAPVLAIAIATPAFAIDRTVPGDYPSIQAAIDASGNNDAVNVGPGTYFETIDLGDKTGLAIRSTAGPLATIIDGSGNGSVVTIDGGHGTRIEGFTLTGGTGTPGVGRGVDTLGGGVYLFNASPTFSHCIIRDNTATRGGGVYAAGGSDASFDNCLLHSNVAGQSGGAFALAGSSLASVLSCTVADNVATTAGAMNLASFSFAGFANSILWGNGLSPVVEAQNAAAFYGHCNADFAIPGDSISADPMFLNAATGRYELTEGSPCVDAGNASIAGAIAKDLAGNSRAVTVSEDDATGIRLFDLYIDIGAYEYPVVCADVECEGDTNGDGVVNVSDLLDVINNWGTTCID